jgi:hypothetical protein
MIGTNIIQINHATVLEALQEYFNKRLVQKPVIKSIATQSCNSWTHTTDAACDFGRLEVRIQENGAFLEGEQA